MLQIDFEVIIIENYFPKPNCKQGLYKLQKLIQAPQLKFNCQNL